MNQALFLLIFSCFGLLAAAAPELTLSSATVSDGDVQALTLKVEAPTTADVYLLLSGPGGSLRALKADGEFTAPGLVAPRLSKVSLEGSFELATLRLTGLSPGAYTWSAALTEPGAGLDKRARVATAAFTVKKSEGPLFAELAEGGGGGPGAGRRTLASGGLSAGSPPARALRDIAASPAGGPAVEALGIAGAEADPSSLAAPVSPAVAEPLPPPSPASSPAAGVAGGAGGAAPAKAYRPGALAKKKHDAAAVEDLPLEPFGGPEGLAKRPGGLKDAKGEDRLLEEGKRKAAKGEIQAAKALTAGATDDNKDFADFLTFLKDRNGPSVMCQDIAQRRFITVLDAKGRHVSNADVSIKKEGTLLFSGRTLANGQTLFCPATIPALAAGKHTLEIEVEKGLVRRTWSVDVKVAKDEALENRFNPQMMPPQPMPVDIMPLPGCGVGLKPMARKARAAAAPAAMRALESTPVAVKADALDWLGGEFKAAYQTRRAADLSAVPAPPSEREKAVPKGDWILRLPGALPPEAPKLDLVFQIDTTGSMRDEIRAVQATLQSVAKRIDAMDPRPLVRWGLVLYGDRGDAYVVRRYAFTPDVNELHDWVLNMQMTGGGDTPESALEALHASVNEMAWDGGDAIRLVFLIADAPPHLDYKRPYTYVDKMKEAVAKGIKVIPTAASGLNKTGEYIFRQWAQGTMGTFLYITYGAGGAGGKAGTTEHEVKQPKKKNNLDDLIVKAVADEITNWRTPTLYASGEKKVETPKRVP